MYHSINNIDQQLHEKYFSKLKGGYFIEAGANDGLLQSNTAFFEKEMKWTGILVEPIFELFQQCVRNRSFNTIIVNKALGSEDNQKVPLLYTPQSHGLMSAVEGIPDQESHLKKAGESGEKRTCYSIKLDTLIYNYTPPSTQIDLLSLDVEGFEPQALNGLRDQAKRINYICIEEQYNQQEIEQLLKKTHKKIEQLSEHDYLWKRL